MFQYVHATTEGPVPWIGNDGSKYTERHYTALPVDTLDVQTGFNAGNYWYIHKINTYAYYTTTLDGVETSVTKEEYDATVPLELGIKLKFVPSNTFVTFAAKVTDVSGEESLTSIWQNALNVFADDMLAGGYGLEREAWRLSYVDDEGDMSLILDGLAVALIYRRALQNKVSSVKMFLTPKGYKCDVPEEDAIEKKYAERALSIFESNAT